jgi:hypothetical protein
VQPLEVFRAALFGPGDDPATAGRPGGPRGRARPGARTWPGGRSRRADRCSRFHPEEPHQVAYASPRKSPFACRSLRWGDRGRRLEGTGNGRAWPAPSYTFPASPPVWPEGDHRHPRGRRFGGAPMPGAHPGSAAATNYQAEPFDNSVEVDPAEGAEGAVPRSPASALW